MKKLLFILLTVIFFVSATLFFVVFPITQALSLPAEVRLTYDEYLSQSVLPSGRFVTQQNSFDMTVGEEGQKYVDLKLFGIFKIKRIKVDVLPVEQLAAGGIPVGFVAKTQGVLVIENAAQYGLKKGDIIRKVNDTEITSIEDFNRFISLLTGKQTLCIEFARGSNLLTSQFEVNLDNTRQLGLWLKDETSGVGILTYVNPQNNNFAALGHKLTDYETGVPVDVCGGDVYRTNVIGLNKSSGSRVGELKSTLKQGSRGKQGSILSSNSGGVFGCLSADSELLTEACTLYPVGSRYSVKPGKAKLRTCLDGENVREYDIEIIKAYYQTRKDIKSMIVRITDKELLAQSGGIIHGMSGSPIIQNGKIIGALTHVIVNDVTKGYGIYIDFVIP